MGDQIAFLKCYCAGGFEKCVGWMKRQLLLSVIVLRGLERVWNV